MRRIKQYIFGIYNLISFFSITFVTWRIIRCWYAGCDVKKPGNTINETFGASVEKQENVSSVSNCNNNCIGKTLDEAIIDTKKAFGKATDIVKQSINHAK